MTDTAIDRSVPAKAAPGRGRASAAKPRIIVSGSELAAHLDCSKQNVAKLEREGIIERTRGGFNLDASRMRYIQHLRRARQASAVNAAAKAHTEAKTRLLEQRLAQRNGELVPKAIFDEMIEAACGRFLTALNTLPVLIGGRDIPLRHRVEGIVRNMRRDLAERFEQEAREFDEKIERHREGIE